MVWPEIILNIALLVKSNMPSISARFSYTLTSFLTEWTQKHNIGVYHRVFKYAGHGGVVWKYFRYCIMGKIQDGHHLWKPKIKIIVNRMEADPLFW